MAIVLRFVDRFGILKEQFFDLVHKRGASYKRGEFNGLKALINKDSHYADYVHCFAHMLQLALIGATKRSDSHTKKFSQN
jgi:hypothetical protein